MSSRIIRRFARSFIAVTTVVAIAQTASAWEPLDRLGRLCGVGFGDGYHACESDHRTVIADLPPRTFAGLTDRRDLSYQTLPIIEGSRPGCGAKKPRRLRSVGCDACGVSVTELDSSNHPDPDGFAPRIAPSVRRVSPIDSAPRVRRIDRKPPAGPAETRQLLLPTAQAAKPQPRRLPPVGQTPTKVAQRLPVVDIDVPRRLPRF